MQRILVAVATIAVLLGMAGMARPTAAAGLSPWDGGIDVYRAGVFTTQQTWQWCTAADVQIIRNIVDRRADHARSSQQRFFDAMRAHNRYDLPVADGVDPAGWAYGLRHFVDDRYRLVVSGSFDAALRSAVTSLRRTNLPVGITVGHGNHAWVLTGFTATADPAATTRFTVTSVRVTGPLWGLQSRTYGYDMRPDTRLTPRQLAGFFTPWHYARIRMAWEGRWVSIQPTGTAALAGTPAAIPPPDPRRSAGPSPSGPASPGASLGTATAAPGAAARTAVPGDVAFGANPSGGPRAADDPAITSVAGSRSVLGAAGWLAAVAVVALALAIVLAGFAIRLERGRIRRRRSPTRPG